MRQAEDIVWSTITESAKCRLDYTGFKNSLGASGDDRTAEFILFQIIEGYAEDLSLTDILSKIRGDLLLFGYTVSDDELNAVLADKKEVLEKEISAAKEALSEFVKGTHADDVLVQVSSLLL
ncbi:MAG: hypothetical protein OEL75_04385 [Kiritimatiellaceae bacterium]|nr:hypothetical protein [Kiritimatiellaceae bacterium]